MESKGSESVTIKTSPERVYNLLIDLGHIGGITPEFSGAEWLEGATGPHAGARFLGRRDGSEPTECRVLRAMPGEEWAFKTDVAGDNPATWRYEFERDGDGSSTVTLRWDAPGRDADAIRTAAASSLQSLKQRAEG